ncbi:DUF6281 family protein [Streptomyces mesophilus]|uniref:DUF6281 family protein n=1 Tax=Streptomyces mesophilus TaxID=1775132 RepID=UPI00331CBFD0
MTARGRILGSILAVPLVVVTAACSSNSGGSASAVCAEQYQFDDRTYVDIEDLDITVGQELGVAVSPPCDDAGGKSNGEKMGEDQTAYRVKGVSPEIAIAVGDSPEQAKIFVSYEGKELPPEVEELKTKS